MVQKEGQGARLATIIIELNLYGYIDKKKLIEQFSVTERTIYRDLNLLSPILEHCGNGKYILTTSSARNSSNDLLTFLDAKKYLPVQDAKFWKILPQRIKKQHICINANETEHSVSRDLQKHFSLLETAIDENRQCKILYKKKNRIINPYKLTNRNGIWYLNAVEDNKIKSFSLSSMEWSELTSITFKHDNEIRKIIDESGNAWVSNQEFDIVVTVDREAARYFKRRNLLPKQRILQDEPQALKISCKAASEKQILPLIQYWLPHITIDEPAWLNKRLIENISQYQTRCQVIKNKNKEQLYTSNSPQDAG